MHQLEAITTTDFLPLAYTHVTSESFISMRKHWTTAWSNHQNLTRSVYKVLRELAFLTDPEIGVAYPRQETLAKKLGISLTSVERAVRALAKIGAIEILKGDDRPKKLGRMVNYRVRFDRLPNGVGYEVTTTFLSWLEPVA